jgi:hypothetical protein
MRCQLIRLPLILPTPLECFLCDSHEVKSRKRFSRNRERKDTFETNGRRWSRSAPEKLLENISKIFFAATVPTAKARVGNDKSILATATIAAGN